MLPWKSHTSKELLVDQLLLPRKVDELLISLMDRADVLPVLAVVLNWFISNLFYSNQERVVHETLGFQEEGVIFDCGYDATPVEYPQINQLTLPKFLNVQKIPIFEHLLRYFLERFGTK